MGCLEGKTVEESGRENYGFPTCRKTIELEKELYSVLVFDNNRILLGARDELQILDLKTSNISVFSKEHVGKINVLIKLKEDSFASGGQDNKIKIWNINSNESLMTLEGHKSMVWCLDKIDDNKLISGGSDRRALVWDIKEKKLDFELFKGGEISIVHNLKNGKVLLCSDNNLCLFDLESKNQISSITTTGVWALKELHDGTIAIGQGNGDISILDIGNEIKTKLVLKGHKKCLSSIIELDNHRLVSSSDENNMILWNLNDPEGKYYIEGQTSKVVGIVHLGGNKFASVSGDKTLKIWE